MRIIDLAIKDLLQILRDWKAALFLVVMPIGFTIFMGLIFGGVGEGDPRLPIGFIDQDDGKMLSIHLLDLLNDSDTVRPVEMEASVEQADEDVRDQELVAVVIVPAGYSEGAMTGDSIPLPVIVDSNTTAGTTARNAIQTAATRLQGAVKTAQLSAQILEAQGGSANEAFVEETLQQAIRAWREPPLTVAMRRSGQEAQTDVEAEEDQDQAISYTHTSPGMMVQFSIAGLIGAAEVIVAERKSRSLQRLMTTAISRTEILLGHYLAMFVMIFGQLVLLVGFGQLALGLDYARRPTAILLVLIAMALWTAALGLLIGVMAKDENQVVIFSMIPMFVLSGLGGAWMPLEVTGETFQTIGHLLPSAWAMDGLKNIILRGQGLESVLLPASIMLAYAVVLFGLAAWRFSVSET